MGWPQRVPAPWSLPSAASCRLSPRPRSSLQGRLCQRFANGKQDWAGRMEPQGLAEAILATSPPPAPNLTPQSRAAASPCTNQGGLVTATWGPGLPNLAGALVQWAKSQGRSPQQGHMARIPPCPSPTHFLPAPTGSRPVPPAVELGKPVPWPCLEQKRGWSGGVHRPHCPSQ